MININTKQWKSFKSQGIEKLNNRRVIIFYDLRKSGYKGLKNCVGTIKNVGGQEVGILIDNKYNNASSKGLYWFLPSEFILLEEETEDLNMAKLTGFEKVAVIKRGYGTYHYAIYNDGNDYNVGDLVYCSGTGGYEPRPIEEIISVDEANKRFGKNITAEVICKIDMSAYETRVLKRKEAEKLKKEMDKVIKQMDENSKYDMYAARNPELAEMLERFKELSA